MRQKKGIVLLIIILFCFNYVFVFKGIKAEVIPKAVETYSTADVELLKFNLDKNEEKNVRAYLRRSGRFRFVMDEGGSLGDLKISLSSSNGYVKYSYAASNSTDDGANLVASLNSWKWYVGDVLSYENSDSSYLTLVMLDGLNIDEKNLDLILTDKRNTPVNDLTYEVITSLDEITIDDEEVDNLAKTFLEKAFASAFDHWSGKSVDLFVNTDSVLKKTGIYEVSLSTIQSTSKVVRVIVKGDPIINALNKISYERTFNVNEKQFFKDVNASMDNEGILTSNFSKNVNFDIADNYTVFITGTDLNGNSSAKIVYVSIIDTIYPIVTMKTEITYKHNQVVYLINFYRDLDVLANEFATISTNIGEFVDTSVIGSYVVDITVSDFSNNSVVTEVKVNIVK